METKILAYLKAHEGARKREIAHAIGTWQCNAEFLRAMHELEARNEIGAVCHRDAAQMELYDRWYTKTEL